MITKIPSLKNFGIYENYVWDGSVVGDFRKYNLFYGWNGSGKSTLAKLFYQVAKKQSILREDFGEFQFKIELDDKTIIDEKSFEVNALNLFVFNSQFVEDNINWNDKINNILLVSKDHINEAGILKENRHKKQKKEDNLKKLASKKSEIETSSDKFFSHTANRIIKEKFKIIDTSDKYYFNYDKRRLESFIEENPAVFQDASILSDEKVEALTEAIRPNQFPENPLVPNKLESTQILEVKTRLGKVLNESVIVEEIKRFIDYPDIGRWVEMGFQLHKTHQSNHCEFCGELLQDKRLTEIEKHFSTAFKELKGRIQKAIEWLPTKKVNESFYNEFISTYPEFRKDYSELVKRYEEKSRVVNGVIDHWINLLRQKYDNPFEKFPEIPEISANTIDDFNEIQALIAEMIQKHNRKTQNFKEETDKLKKKLELHYAAQALKEYEYTSKQKQSDCISVKVGILNKQIAALSAEIYKLEALLANAQAGEEEFNEKLRRFIGRSDISIKFNQSKNGYEIIRNGKKARNLSEGEKTAFAFVYFVTKLRENGNTIEESIVLVDDPISSFDSNHLFSAYSFLKSECEQAKQIFVLTHNFNYFKLIRDWFVKKKEKKQYKFSIYSIESAISDGDRSSKICQANDSLVKYNSEYHYIFSKILSFKEEQIQLENAYLIANLARKLLEAFLTFKYPRQRSDFKRLMDDALKSEPDLSEKIYRFINKYSHNQVIDFFEGMDDNVLAESQTIVKDILEKVIRNTDQIHYDEMLVALGEN